MYHNHLVAHFGRFANFSSDSVEALVAKEQKCK